MPHLRMLRGPQPGTEYELTAEIIQIGRGRKNDIIIQDNEVSREHCRLVRVLDDYELHDLNSTNGTFVNGARIDARGSLLSTRQLIELGDSITLEYLPTEELSITRPPSTSDDSVNEWRQMYLVIHRRHQTRPRIHALQAVAVSIGRATDNDVSINVPEISRHHMRLVRSGSKYLVEDLGSTNGTMLNDDQLTQQQSLKNGDCIRVGEAIEIYYTDDPASMLAELDNQAEDKTKLPKVASDGKGVTKHFNEDEPRPEIRATTAMLSSPLGMLAPDAPPSRIGPGLHPDQLVNHVFLASVREDWRVMAGALFVYLEDRDVPIWADQYLPAGSRDWRIAYDQALAECEVLLVILSEASLAQEHIQRAIRHFHSREKPILLVQRGEVTRPPIIVSHLPIIHYQASDPVSTYEAIVQAVKPLTERANEASEADSKPAAPPDSTEAAVPRTEPAKAEPPKKEESTAEKSDSELTAAPESPRRDEADATRNKPPWQTSTVETTSTNAEPKAPSDLTARPSPQRDQKPTAGGSVDKSDDSSGS